MADQKPEDHRRPMTVFTAGERFKESVHAIGDVTLFRPMSFLEILVGMPLCAIFCYLIVYPLTDGSWAIAAFGILVYFAPKALVMAEAKAGRPVAAEAAAAVRFFWACAWRANLYQGTQRLSPRTHKHKRRTLNAMLREEDEAAEEIAAGRRKPGAD